MKLLACKLTFIAMMTFSPHLTNAISPIQDCRYANIIKVVDGDTFHAMVSLGYGIVLKETFRLARYNAPETRTRNKEEKKRGLKAKARLIALLQRYQNFIIVCSDKKGKYGRRIAEVLTPDGNKNINDILIQGSKIL